MMPVFPSLIYTALLICLPGMALSAEDPDVLYEKGRFADAEKIYAESDMDHPNDLRYRYNRGCAAYQNSDFKGAMAAFSSVLRRASAEKEDTGENSQFLFNSAYNLGNTAFKLGDFQSAAEYYRQALKYDSKSEDVKYNLELALRETEKQKKQDKQEKAPDKQSDQDESQDKNNQEKPDKNGEDRGGEKLQEKKSDNDSKDDPEPEKKEEGRGADEKESGQDQPEDLSGDLKPLQEMPEEKSRDQAEAQEEEKGIDRKRAGAILDNVREDPSKVLKFQFREESRRGVGSGKDW